LSPRHNRYTAHRLSGLIEYSPRDAAGGTQHKRLRFPVALAIHLQLRGKIGWRIRFHDDRAGSRQTVNRPLSVGPRYSTKLR
jgi:hypothetical protein